MSYDKNMLAERSGEKGFRRPPKYIVPGIKFDGRVGKFTKTIQKDKDYEEQELGKTLDGVVLKIRRGLFAFGKDERLFTNEHNTNRDHIVLFETITGKGGSSTSKIDEGDNIEIRERHQNVKTIQYLYILVNGDICKLGVRGSSLGSFYKYLGELGEGEHIFENVLKITSRKEAGKLGEYYVMEFAQGEATDLEEIGPKIEEVADALDAQDKFYERAVVAKVASDDEPPIESYMDNGEHLTSEAVDPEIEDGIPVAGIPF